MPTWIIKHIVTGQTVGEQATKKAATAQAKEMTDAHVAVDAKHEGQPVGFIALKAVEPPTQESVGDPERD